MVRRKIQIPNIVRGGIAIPLNKNNMFLMKGRKHSQGGIDIGNNPSTGMEVEDGEVVQMTNNGAKIFSTMPFLNGQSPANKVLNGQNPNEVFKHQENFKKRNNINNDGTYGRGENLGFGNASAQEFQNGGSKGIKVDIDKNGLPKSPANNIKHTDEDGNVRYGERPLVEKHPELLAYSILGGGLLGLLRKGYNIYKTGKAIYNRENMVGPFDLGKGAQSQKGRKAAIKKDMLDLINNGAKEAVFKGGGYRSSNNIRRRIAKMEGSSMKTNRAFDLEDRDFYNAIPGNVRSKLNQDALDNLYSYSYNVGAGAFKRRVVPALTALTNGTGTVKAVQDSMYASKDKQLRGLRIRRNIEKQGFADAYNRYNNINNTLANTQNMIDNIQEKVEPPVVEQDNTYVQKPIEIKGIEMPKKQKRYNSELIKLGMNMLNNKVKYNSTFAAGGRKNLSTGNYSQTAKQKKIDVLNKMKKDNAEFNRKYNTLSKSEQLYVHAGKDTKDINKRLNDSYYKHPNNYIANRNSISPFARNDDKFDIKTDATNLSNKVNRDLRRQAISDYNRRQINKSDAIGLASNVLGSVTSGMINDRMLSSMKYPSAPVRTTAAKLKTNYNINPQLDALRENLYNAYQSINDSTNSSQVALARRQRYAFNNTLAANGLYGNKENQQAQLINQDRLNQQQNTANNVAAYNQWNQNKAAFDNSVAEKRAENSVGILQNINAGVQDVLARREQRQHDNNTIKAMFAANPNVTPEYFGHYGLNLYRFGGKRFNRR